jgi:hypothetical protein
LPYCRRCGTKLDEDAHFCHKCGTPVSTYNYGSPPTSAPLKPIRKDPVVIAASVLVSILVVGVVVAALVTTPFINVSIGQTYQDNTADINKLNFNFESNQAQVNVFTIDMNNNNFVIEIQGSAAKGMSGGNSDSPIQFTLYNDTTNGVQTVTIKLEESTTFSRYKVVCNIYVNPALTINLNITSKTGQVSLTNDKPTTFESINLEASAGAVGANLQNATVTGNVTLRTQAGTVDFRTSQIVVEGNNTINLHSNAGSINMDLTQTKTLQGNLQVNATAEFGSVNVDLSIDGAVGAKIISQTTLGSIHTNLQHFSGNQSLIQSDNYPTAGNIEINNRTNLGNIDINAIYQSTSSPYLRN